MELFTAGQGFVPLDYNVGKQRIAGFLPQTFAAPHMEGKKEWL